MRIRQLVASVLVRCYPVKWRREYGAELRDLLERRPLRTAIVADVIVSALRHRAAVASVSTKLGLLTMLLMLLGVAAASANQANAWHAIIRPSGMTFPPAKVTFFATDVFTLLLVWCGWRTESTRIAKWYDSGYAAVRMTLIGGLPVILAGALLALNTIDVAVVQRGANTAWTPSALALMVAPLSRAPESWLWGVLGGWLARRFAPSKRAAQAL
jgi:hypothetical protein